MRFKHEIKNPCPKTETLQQFTKRLNRYKLCLCIIEEHNPSAYNVLLKKVICWENISQSW